MLTLLLASLLASPAALAQPRPAAVEHTATLQDETVAWESRIVLDKPGTEPVLVPLALPLAGPVEGVPASTVLHRDERGRVVAVEVPAWRDQAGLRTVQPAPGGAAAALVPPLVAGEAVQRLDLDGLRWEPDPALGLERRMRHTVPIGMDQAARRAVDRVLDGRPVPRGSRVYVVADADVVAAGGLSGPVSSAGEVPLGVALAVGATFALVLGGGILGYRLLEGQARRERLERYMEDEFVRRELEQVGRARPSPTG